MPHTFPEVLVRVTRYISSLQGGLCYTSPTKLDEIKYQTGSFNHARETIAITPAAATTEYRLSGKVDKKRRITG